MMQFDKIDAQSKIIEVDSALKGALENGFTKGGLLFLKKPLTGPHWGHVT